MRQISQTSVLPPNLMLLPKKRQQLAKKTFDYWWNANSSVVFSELSKWSGLVASPLISKYELMLLCVLADKPNQ